MFYEDETREEAPVRIVVKTMPRDEETEDVQASTVLREDLDEETIEPEMKERLDAIVDEIVRAAGEETEDAPRKEKWNWQEVLRNDADGEYVDEEEEEDEDGLEPNVLNATGNEEDEEEATLDELIAELLAGKGGNESMQANVMAEEAPCCADAEEASCCAAASAEEEMPASGTTSDEMLVLARRALVQARDTLSSVIELLDAEKIEAAKEKLSRFQAPAIGGRHQILEGVFDGERMVSANGALFDVPANYASKSRLVEGDLLKLTMLSDGHHVYKQIGPVARERVSGILARDEVGGFCLLCGGRRFRLLASSVSFYRGRPGDEVIAVIPRGMPSRFAAVETILHRA